MKNKKLIILKIGGSVITDKEKNRKKINIGNLKRIAWEIACARKKKNFSLLLVHGAGTFGHKTAKKFNLHEGYENHLQIKAISDLSLDLKKLSLEFIKSLKKEDLPAISFKQSSAWELSSGRLEKCNLEIIKKYLELGFIPVLHGDILLDKKMEFGILSGDQIVFRLAKDLRPQRVLIGTDTDGVFNCNPKTNKKAQFLKEINSFNLNKLDLGESTAEDVTGGMKGKVIELFNLARSAKIESEIINIKKEGILKRALLGKKGLGTTIKFE